MIHKIVSVIIPAYNCASFIQHSLESVLKQTFNDMEILVIDDGSTDDTVEKVRKFTNVKLFQKKNGGAASARNFGIERATGKYIAFLDADDIWVPNKLEQQLNLLESADESTAFCYGDYGIIEEDGRISTENLPAEKLWNRKSGDIFHDLILTCFVFTSTVVVRRDVLDTVGGFAEDLKIGEDYDLWLRLAASYSALWVDKVVAYYRNRQGSLTRCNVASEKPWEVMVVERAIKRDPERCAKVSKRALADRFARCYFQLGYQFFWSGEPVLAKGFFRQAIKQNPLSGRVWLYMLLSSKCCNSLSKKIIEKRIK